MTAGSRVPVSRRRFLARCGALGAAAVVGRIPGWTLASPAAASADGRAALGVLARDTIAGLVAFVVPGADPYSRAQGLTDDRPGGLDARAPDGIIEVFDHYLGMPDALVRPMAAGFATGMSDVPLPGSESLVAGGEELALTVDQALAPVLENDETVPLSLLIALMLNYVATSVRPAAVAGPFPGAPFANLQYSQKGEAFRRIEEDNAELLALIDGQAPEPMRAALSGQVAALGGLLTAGAALYAYCEWGVFDERRGRATRRPVGWDLANYMPGRTRPADGWDELKGYYRGHRRARPTPASGRRGDAARA